MKSQLFNFILALFFGGIIELKAQRISIPIRKFWSYSSKDLILLNDKPLKLNNKITLEESYLGLFFKSINVIKKRYIEIEGYICKEDTITCSHVEGLRIFAAKKKHNFLIDTINLYTEISTNTNDRQNFKIRFNILNSDYLYIYGPGFLLDEFSIVRLRRDKLRK